MEEQQNNEFNLSIDSDVTEKEKTVSGDRSHHSHSSHHHSSHHSHYSRHYSSGKHKKNKNNSKRSSKEKKRFVLLTVSISLLFAFVLFAAIFISFEKGNEVGKEEALLDNELIIETGIAIREFDEPVILVNDAVVEYMNTNPTVDGRDTFNKYRDSSRLDQGRGVEFAYTITDDSIKGHVEKATLELCEKGNDKTSVYDFIGSDNKLTVYNLKANTQYEYTIIVRMSNGYITKAESQFVTANYPRMLSVDGIFNVRDIGGWKTLDGNVIKQGLLYRGTELDGVVENPYKLTSYGVNTMRNEFSIKTDMDLRNPIATGNIGSSLGIDVTHFYYSADLYEGIFTEAGKEKNKWIFADLANKGSYPVYLHCTYGCDRTGTVCYLLEILLGVSETDAVRDYELSNLFVPTVNRNSIMTVYNNLQSYEGKTLQEKTENYLISAGVTKEQIESIREIFLEEVE